MQKNFRLISKYHTIQSCGSGGVRTDEIESKLARVVELMEQQVDLSKRILDTFANQQ